MALANTPKGLGASPPLKDCQRTAIVHLIPCGEKSRSSSLYSVSLTLFGELLLQLSRSFACYSWASSLFSVSRNSRKL